MIRDYMLVSPSLDGILSHSSMSYEGLKRPVEILRVLDGPVSKGNRKEGAVKEEPLSMVEQKVLSGYLHDLYGVFMKSLSQFAIDPYVRAEEVVKLQAMLQEIIKVKKLMIH